MAKVDLIVEIHLKPDNQQLMQVNRIGTWRRKRRRRVGPEQTAVASCTNLNKMEGSGTAM